MKVVRLWLLVFIFLLIKFIVNCIKGLLNLSICNCLELMVSGEVDKFVCQVKKKEKNVNYNFD